MDFDILLPHTAAFDLLCSCLNMIVFIDFISAVETQRVALGQELDELQHKIDIEDKPDIAFEKENETLLGKVHSLCLMLLGLYHVNNIFTHNT